MIHAYINDLDQLMVTFKGDDKELKDDLVRILYTMATRDMRSRRAVFEACREVDDMLKCDFKGVFADEP